MPRKSKDKEARHLAQVIPMLAAWWGEAFAKVPASGALRWGNGFWTYADICPPESLPFVIECKFHAEIDIDEVLRKPINNGKITWFWYYETIRDALRATEEMGYTLYPMLIYRVNQNTNRVVIQDSLYFNLPKCRDIRYVHVRIPEATDFVVCDLITFLRHYPREVFEKLWKE